MVKLYHSEWKIDLTDNVSRFVKAHESMYETALSEVRNGKKESHWIWYILPQLRGLGSSYNANYYGLRGLDEAQEYLKNPILAAHMKEILRELLNLSTNNPEDIFGKLDAKKLKSSMTLFDLVSPDNIYSRILDKYFNGQRDNRTIYILERCDEWE